MRAKVDASLCVGTRTCQAICPAVFKVENDLAQVIADPVPPDQEDACREAADNCPTEAISIEA